MNRIPSVVQRLLLSATLCGTAAADLYMLPDGSGDASGSDWDNALSYAAAADSLQQAWERLQPGDTLFLGGGEYEARPVTLSAPGGADKVLTLKGVDRDGARVVFQGTWQKEDRGNGFTLITLAPESSGWVLENFEVRNVRGAVETKTPGRVSDGKILNVDVRETRDAVVIRGGALAADPDIGSHNIELRDCDVNFYTKRGFRFRDGCYDIRVVNCTADAGGKDWYVEPFPMGFNVIGGAKGTNVYDHDITFIDCVARNNWHVNGDDYWNGDGFCAEGAAYNLTYIRCESTGNTDGGWDDKSLNPLLIGCIARDNKKNFRFWSHQPGALLWNCLSEAPHKRGGNSNQVGLWTKGKVRIRTSSFLDSNTPLALNDWRVTPEQLEIMHIEVGNSLIELPEGTELTGQGFSLTDTVTRNLDVGGTTAEGVGGTTAEGVGYQEDKRDAEVLLAEVRPHQPRIEKEGQLLEAKPLSVFGDRNPSGWYLSGWRSADMKIAKGKGIDGSNALAVTAGDGGGGANYRTKRDSASIKFANFEKTRWALKMSVNTGGADLGTLEIRALTLASAPNTKELRLPGDLDGSKDGWQELSIPLADFTNAGDADFEDFAGFYIRANGSLPGPLYIDNVRLEPLR